VACNLFVWPAFRVVNQTIAVRGVGLEVRQQKRRYARFCEISAAPQGRPTLKQCQDAPNRIHLVVLGLHSRADLLSLYNN